MVQARVSPSHGGFRSLSPDLQIVILTVAPILLIFMILFFCKCAECLFQRFMPTNRQRTQGFVHKLNIQESTNRNVLRSQSRTRSAHQQPQHQRASITIIELSELPELTEDELHHQSHSHQSQSAEPPPPPYHSIFPFGYTFNIRNCSMQKKSIDDGYKESQSPSLPF